MFLSEGKAEFTYEFRINLTEPDAVADEVFSVTNVEKALINAPCFEGYVTSIAASPVHKMTLGYNTSAT